MVVWNWTKVCLSSSGIPQAQQNALELGPLQKLAPLPRHLLQLSVGDSLLLFISQFKYLLREAFPNYQLEAVRSFMHWETIFIYSLYWDIPLLSCLVISSHPNTYFSWYSCVHLFSFIAFTPFMHWLFSLFPPKNKLSCLFIILKISLSLEHVHIIMKVW